MWVTIKFTKAPEGLRTLTIRLLAMMYHVLAGIIFLYSLDLRMPAEHGEQPASKHGEVRMIVVNTVTESPTPLGACVLDPYVKEYH